MQWTIPVLAALLLAAAPSVHAHAEAPPTDEEASARQIWQAMSPQERRQAREELRERWQALPPEERRARREQARQRAAVMTPAQRRAEPPTVPGAPRHREPPAGERGRLPDTPDAPDRAERPGR